MEELTVLQSKQNIFPMFFTQSKPMGARYSSVYASTNQLNRVASPKKSGRVISFHSSATWKTHFEASKQTNKLMVIDFTASWCGPCHTMEPIMRDFAATYIDVEFIKIDVDELDDVAREYGVQAMPTFILIKKGKQVDKFVGAKKEQLQKKIEKNMV